MNKSKNKFNKSKSQRIQRMKALLDEINPLQRMINSPGMDESFKIFKREFPNSTIHSYPSDSKIEDWVVPKSWEVIEGFMKDEKDNIIASIDENILFVAPYSEPVEGWFTKSEIQKHLRTRKDKPKSFLLEHRNTYDYQLVDWGITLPHERWSDLPDKKYFIKIKVKMKKNSMKVGEYFLPGEKKETICICAHIDELCNDDLSGCIVGMEIMKYLETLPKRKYSYQLLWVPELFGPLYFASKNKKKISHTIGMLNLEAVGAGEKWCMKKAWKPNTLLEDTLRFAMKQTGIEFNELEFFEGYINDEKVYAWPKINVNGVAIQRFPFQEYHTADDVPELIDFDLMIQAVNYSEKFIEVLEKNYIPEYKNFLPPWLTKRNLYFDFHYDRKNHDKFNNQVLYSIDGKKSLMDLSQETGIKFDDIYKYLDNLVKAKIIKKNKLNW